MVIIRLSNSHCQGRQSQNRTGCQLFPKESAETQIMDKFLFIPRVGSAFDEDAVPSFFALPSQCQRYRISMTLMSVEGIIDIKNDGKNQNLVKFRCCTEILKLQAERNCESFKV